MNSLLLLVNSAIATAPTQQGELIPLLMSKLFVGLAIFAMLIFFNKISSSTSTEQQINTFKKEREKSFNWN